MESGKNRSPTEREVIERQLAEVRVSITSAEIDADLEGTKAGKPKRGEARASDRLVELLIARLLRIAHRNDLLQRLGRLLKDIRPR